MCPAQNRCSEKSNSSGGGGDDLDDNASVGGGDVIGKGYSSRPTIVASNLAQIDLMGMVTLSGCGASSRV